MTSVKTLVMASSAATKALSLILAVEEQGMVQPSPHCRALYGNNGAFSYPLPHNREFYRR